MGGLCLFFVLLPRIVLDAEECLIDEVAFDGEHLPTDVWQLELPQRIILLVGHSRDVLQHLREDLRTSIDTTLTIRRTTQAAACSGYETP